MSAVIEGLPELRASLRKLTDGSRRNVQREVKRSALNVQSGAKKRAPVDTGRLRNSIAHEVEQDGLEATIGSNVEYAPHQEFGTSRHRAQPFLFPALEEERPRFLAAMRRAVLDAAEAAR